MKEYILTITRIKYPINDTLYYSYSSIDNLLKDLKDFIENHKVVSQDVIRIEER